MRLDFFLHFLKTFPLLIILSGIIMIQMLFIILLIKYKNKSRDYKIYYFKINTIILSIYFIVFILMMLYFRYLRWGIYINMAPILEKAKTLFNQMPIFYGVILILSLIIFYLIFLHVKNYMHRSILKRHLYYYYKMLYSTLLTAHNNNKTAPLTTIIIKYPLYVRIIKNLSGKWSYDFLLDMYIYHNFVLPYCTLKDVATIPSWMNKPLKKFVNFLPSMILISLFCYECLFHNFSLHYIFYYLPFFIGFKLFVNVTHFLANTNNSLNRIIYERYYEEDNVLYVNTTEEEDKVILDYISHGFICFSHKVTGDNFSDIWAKKEAILDFAPNFMKIRRFVKSRNDPTVFVNSVGQRISSENMIIHEIYR